MLAVALSRVRGRVAESGPGGRTPPTRPPSRLRRATLAAHPPVCSRLSFPHAAGAVRPSALDVRP